MFRKKKPEQLDLLTLYIEMLEPRVMLNGTIVESVFSSDFEDLDVPRGGFQFFAEVSGLTATGKSVEIQNNHPSVGPANEGNNLLELDGTNGVFVDLPGNNGPLFLEFAYSARPNVERLQNAIEVYWNGELVETVSAEGTGLKSTDFEQFEFQLDATENLTSRLEFRSNSPEDTIGLGGLLDDIHVYRNRSELFLESIEDQELQIGDALDVTARLATDSDMPDGVEYSIVDGPAASKSIRQLANLPGWQLKKR